jgi:GMP synthase-like glutamine amidotransferase
MSPDPVVVIQTQSNMPPGLLAAWARVRDIPLDVRRIDLGDRLPDAPSAVVVLGSSAGVNDHSVPWLADLRAWTSDLLDADTPAFGISFGAQLIAQLLGARVVRANAPEAGWVEVGSSEPWLPAGAWLSWHRDAILPSNALVVAARNVHGTQAFASSADGRQMGVQFHPEATTATIAAWARDAGLTSTEHHAILNAQTARHCAAATTRARMLFEHWARTAGLQHSEQLLAAA